MSNFLKVRAALSGHRPDVRHASAMHNAHLRALSQRRSASLFSPVSHTARLAGALSEVRRYGGSGSNSSGWSESRSTASSRSFPRVPRMSKPDVSGNDAASLPPIIDTPKPPRPAFYVPPEERDPADESLAFMKPGSPLQHLTQQRQTDAELPDGLDLAPSLQLREKAAPTYMDEDAKRVRSTSVHAGQPLLNHRSVVDTSSYYYTPPRESSESGGRGAIGGAEAPYRSRLHALHDTLPHSSAETAPPGLGHPAAEALGSATTPKDRSMFTASHEFAAVDKTAGEAEDEKQRKAPKPAVKQLEADIKKLEYYYGTPQYDKLLAEFRAKYGAEKSEENVNEGASTAAATPSRVYTTSEVAQGLEAQPIDYLRGSSKLQAQLLSGPRAYDPVTIMQQHGVMRYQGYAFPPTVELGKLKGDTDQLKMLHDAHRSHPLVTRVRQSFNALVGRTDARDDYVAAADKSKEDTHIVYRTLGLDAVQRRQMRYMLTDFDHADRHTTFHVMMSYPYTDWLHVFYMVLVGWCLYQLQVRYGAYEFYDEYMGLDLRQVPRLQKPVLAGITVVVMVFLLFQPLLVASIATTRGYRIVMRRPIGPP